jgi:probable DNA repair protein
MLNMPHATTERELSYSETLIGQLKQSANHVIFSCPETNGDIHLRPTSLLNSLEWISLSNLALSDNKSPAEKIFEARQIEEFVDEIAPPVQENENIRGGTYIFKQQAVCPFKAFSEIRLHARAVDTPVAGLRPMDRGNIVHYALELIWKVLQDSTTLIKMPETELQTLVKSCALQAIQKLMELTGTDRPNKRYLELESKRLEMILLEWLKLESLRPEFKVALQEHEIKANIGNIPITIRMDRVDELADGTRLIIDYKTGKTNDIKKWFGKRLDEPQLPLYCLVSGDNIAGISFGQLHPDNMTLSGVSKKNINIKTIKTLPETKHADAAFWDQQLQEWKNSLEKLGNDFMQGISHVDPVDIAQVCDHCQLRTFCRIHEKC